MDTSPAAAAAPAGKASAPAPPPPAPATFDEYRRLATPLRCDREIRCGIRHAGDRDACLAAGDHEALNLLGVLRGVAAGRYRYDPSIAAACLHALQVAPCRPDLAAYPARCLGGAVPAPLQPLAPPGAACERWDECDRGLCTGDLGAPGICAAFTRTPEGPCGSNTLCDEGLYCDEGRCRPRGRVGDPCLGHWQACVDGLVCQGYRPPIDDPHYYARAQPGACERPRGLGEACRRVSLGDDCQRPLYCDFAAATPTCALPLPRGATCPWIDACADGTTCLGIDLGPGAAANGSGMREVLRPGVCAPFGDLGAPCDPAAYGHGCPASLRCDPRTNTCAPRSATGEPCNDRNECQGYAFCHPRTRTCQPQAAHGERCAPLRGGDEALTDGPCFLGRCDPRRKICTR